MSFLDQPELAGKLLELGVMLGALVAILWGVVQCFLGYRIIKIVLAFYGFVWGLGVGIIAGVFFLSVVGPLAIIITVLCGVVGALVMVFALYAGIFLLGATLAGGTGYLVGMALMGGAGNLSIIVTCIAGVAGGVLALIFRRFIIIIATSLGGAAEVVVGVFLVVDDRLATALSQVPPDAALVRSISGRRFLVALACWVVLSAAGIVVQYSSAHARESVRKRDTNLDALLETAKEDD